MEKEKILCPHCKKKTKAGNFCVHCGKRIAKICWCHLLKRPYDCGRSKCPNMDEITMLLLHICQDQKRRKYVFLTPLFEALKYKSVDTVQKLSINKRSVLGLRSFNNEVWYKIY